MTEASHDRQFGSKIGAETHQKLWAPWRMSYVGGASKEQECIFCSRLASENDVAALILHRAARSFIIMNLYPYNTGHVMIVPNEHVATPELLPDEVAAEMATLRGPALRATRRSLSCEGFNVGLNVGGVAGAGIAEHMHEHIVPRWLGDANFMPILASTTVMPELIEVTYAKLRAEFLRENALGRSTRLHLMVERENGDYLVERAAGEARLPQIDIVGDETPVWRKVREELRLRGLHVLEFAWAAPARASQSSDGVILVRVTGSSGHETNKWQSRDVVRQLASVMSLDELSAALADPAPPS